ARHERITSCGNAFEIQRSIFHCYALAQNGVSGRRHSKAIRRSVQQCHPQAFLELRDVPPDRHMTDAQRTRGTRQAARARHRKKEAHIVPLPESTRVCSYLNSICEQTDAANGVLAALCLRRRPEREQSNDAHHLDFGADRRPSVPQASPSGRDRPSHQEGIGGMTLILLQVIIQSIASTLYWIGLYVGIRALPGEKSRRLRWIVGSAAVLVVWLVGVMLLAANDVFRTDAPRIPVALLTTLAAGYLLLFSRTFRAIISGIPQHWLIGIQTFRVLGGVFLVRYFQGELSGGFAIPAGVGDVLTGLFAPLVAYWWVAGKPYARTAAIAWNLFGMADLVNAVVLGALTGGGGGGIVFPIVLIPTYAVPRAFLVHSYSLIGL